MACAAARLGLRTALAGVVADDPGGRFMIDELARRGVDVGAVAIREDLATGLTVAFTRGDDRAIVTYPGCIAALEAGMIDPALVGAARHVHASSFFLQPRLAPGLRGLFEAARFAGAGTSLDLNWDPAETWDGGLADVLPAVDVLFVNAAEAAAVSGAPDPAVAATALAARRPTDLLREVVAANRGGRPLGLTSVCSANRFVLETALLHAARGHGLACIESTSNQVNQFGGYTGMTAAAFRDEVAALAAAAGLPDDRLLLGGDHLGPYPWRHEPADTAMGNARELVRSCVLAGYTKIHLDASMRCADDPGAAAAPLSEGIATQRTAELCAAAETAFAQLPAGSPAPLYVIGTEVPTPGGEQVGQAGLSVTPVEDVERALG